MCGMHCRCQSTYVMGGHVRFLGPLGHACEDVMARRSNLTFIHNHQFKTVIKTYNLSNMVPSSGCWVSINCTLYSGLMSIDGTMQ